MRREARPEVEARRFWHLYELAEEDAPKLLHRQTDMDWRTGDVFLPPGEGRFLVAGTNMSSAELQLRAYDVKEGRELWRTNTGQFAGMLTVFLDPTGQWFAYASSKDKLRLISWSDFREVDTTRNGYEAIGPTGKEFAANVWLVWDPRGDSYCIPFDTDWGRGSAPPAFSRDGKLLARCTDKGVVLLVHLNEARRRLNSLEQ